MMMRQFNRGGSVLKALLAATALSGAATATIAQTDTGFAISLNGAPVAGDRAIVERVRTVDIALADADIRVTFDGLGAEPRLDLEQSPGATDGAVVLRSALNYPAYVDRGEMRIVDLAALCGPRVVSVVPVDPNGEVSVDLPQGDDLFVVHRVYDASGRYDETAAQPLGADLPMGSVADVEEGRDTLRRRGIPVFGGAVTVSGASVVQGAQVQALGEILRPDPAGRFVIQRILPQGTYEVDVSVTGPGQSTDLTRDVTIPAADWLAVGTADLTFGTRTGGRDDTSDTYATGRLAGFVNGRTATGYEVTASVDTGEGPLDTLIRDLDEKDPRQLLLRVDPADDYPTFGDDSEIVDLTPTSGKIYVRVAREGNFVQFGDFVAALGDNVFVRNDRTLYGAQAHVESRDQTVFGTPLRQATVHAAQPEQIPQREAFVGTGGSVYFLQQQDIARGTEQLFVQVRDPQSDRIIDSKVLVPGVDYQINYIQGIVTLSRPLSSTSGDGLITSTGSRRDDVVLVAQYEYTPVAGDVDGYATGVRLEGWLTPQLRVGVAGTQDDTGLRDHRLVGGDILFAPSERTYLRIDAAESDGQGIDTLLSFNGGLNSETQAAAAGQGRSLRVEGRADLADLGIAQEGVLGGYAERRDEGFSSLDTQVTETTGDEDLWGVFGDLRVSDASTLKLSYDSYTNETGDEDLEGEAELTTQASERVSYTLGAVRIDRDDAREEGNRTDVAARLTYAFDDSVSAFVIGQKTVDRDGLDRNDRVGLGVIYDTGTGWVIEGEVSDGNQGAGARALAVRTDASGDTQYIGYTLDPERDLDGLDLIGRDRGRVVVGGRRTVSETVSIFGENTYDMFGQRESLTSAYGVTYRANAALTTTIAYEMGQVQDSLSNDFDRHAISVGAAYATEDLTANGRIEYRTEDGTLSDAPLDNDTILTSMDLTYKIDETQRILFSADSLRSRSDQASFRDGDYSDVSLGYALRPIENDRFNMLARYRYLDDQVGQRLDGTDDLGPVQRSHVVSLDASYDVNRFWTLNGKVGYRSAETATDRDATFARNDAALAVIGARYHLVNEWDMLAELRHLALTTADVTETGALIAAFKQINGNVQIGAGYNFSHFSDDLTDLTYDDQGVFLNIVAKY
ncbi:Outer membrane protein beta-barrel domain-containing protein [Loktanella fryxellensis]|uniref:Outer membrane protein beta-barrel domain-containing protein n=1 Tax=Loktanella fryxellensis TaxID=245187 RepID=A0A1H8IZG1_9RHOB|nr:porin family protein [Loktanella fryxellensis]SEN73436.1 Outer membrane protein beta-barrel domain-containing protein [Loktanella fryxellensis]